LTVPDTRSVSSPALHNINDEAVKVVTGEKEGAKKTFTHDVPANPVVVIVSQTR